MQVIPDEQVRYQVLADPFRTGLLLGMGFFMSYAIMSITLTVLKGLAILAATQIGAPMVDGNSLIIPD